MAKDLVEQVELHICEIIRICCVLDIEGGELHKLNDLVGRTSKYRQGRLTLY
jgi:hypothetical protein